MTADIPFYCTNNDDNVLRLFVIRHGQTDSNLNKILQGHKDTELNATGREQASKLGEYLSKERDIHFDKIYSSDLQRCQQTVDSMLQHFEDRDRIEIVTTDKLRERCMGVIEGMYLRDAEAYAEKMGKPSFRDFGEDAHVFQERLSGVINDIVTKNAANKNLAVVSHGGAIRQILRLLNYDEQNASKIIVFNTSVTIIDYNKADHQFAVRRVGNTQHLGSGEFIVSDLNVR